MPKVVFAYIPDGTRSVDGDTGDTVAPEGNPQNVSRDHFSRGTIVAVPNNKIKEIKRNKRPSVRERDQFLHKYQGWTKESVDDEGNRYEERFLRHTIYYPSTNRVAIRHKVVTTYFNGKWATRREFNEC